MVPEIDTDASENINTINKGAASYFIDEDATAAALANIDGQREATPANPFPPN